MVENVVTCFFGTRCSGILRFAQARWWLKIVY